MDAGQRLGRVGRESAPRFFVSLVAQQTPGDRFALQPLDHQPTGVQAVGLTGRHHPGDGDTRLSGCPQESGLECHTGSVGESAPPLLLQDQGSGVPFDTFHVHRTRASGRAT